MVMESVNPPRNTAQILRISLEHIDNEDDFEAVKAFEIHVPMSSSFPKTNISFKAFDNILIQEARQRGLSNFSFAINGFQYLPHEFHDSLSMEQIQGSCGENLVQEYLRSLHGVLMSHLGAKKIILYDWRVVNALSLSIVFSSRALLI